MDTNYVTPAIKSWGAMPVGLYLRFGNNASDFSRGYKKIACLLIFLLFVNLFRTVFFLPCGSSKSVRNEE